MRSAHPALTLGRSSLFPQRFRHRIFRRAGIAVGQRVRILSGLRIAHGRDVRIADGVFINHGCYFDARGGIRIGENVHLADHVRLLTSTHEVGDVDRRAGAATAAPVIVEAACWIGSGAAILSGVTVGAGCVVGAGAVVTKDCEPNGVYVGVPARRVSDLAIGDAVPAPTPG